MRRKTILAALIVAGAAVAQVVEPTQPRSSPGTITQPDSCESLEVGARERLLVIAPHPDDETIGAAGLIQRVIERGGSVRVVLMTAGDAYSEVVRHETRKPEPSSADFIAFGERRIKESQAAMLELDQRGIRLQLLGFPDGGLDALLRMHWSRGDPYRSPTTSATDPPYEREALNPDIRYDGEDLRRELARVIEDARPTLIALPDPLDNHPDHHATGVFGLLALNDWLSRRGSVSSEAGGRALEPRILAYLVHWPHWPGGADDARQPFTLPRDFPAHGLGPVSLEISDQERRKKDAALARYASQQMVMSGMVAFVREAELFIQLGAEDVRNAVSQVPAALILAPSVVEHRDP